MEQAVVSGVFSMRLRPRTHLSRLPTKNTRGSELTNVAISNEGVRDLWRRRGTLSKNLRQLGEDLEPPHTDLPFRRAHQERERRMPMQAERESQQQKLTSIEHGSFDTAALQQELAQALEDDRKYKLTDNAKKRAIHTAANYDEFKNLVACADLKPISQRELRSFSNGERSMNLSYKKAKSRKVYGSNLQLKTEKTDQPPASAVEFARQWRRYLKTTDDKYCYLRLTTPERLGTLFKTDIDADLMAEIARVALTVWKQLQEAEHIQDHAVFTRGTLHAFTQAERFSLILDFLDNNQIEVFRDLFALLEAQTVQADEKDREELHTLKAVYRLER